MNLSNSDHIEAQWLAQIKEGSDVALRQIFDRYYPSLVTDAYRLIKDMDTCRDLAQEAFVELWKKRESISIHTSLRAYLKRAVVNKALNHIKSQQKISFGEADDLESTEDSFQLANSLETQDNLEKALLLAIERLPDKCRIVFSLSRFENLSHKEIAEQLNISVKTIENQITKAMKMLRAAMINYRELSSIVILSIFFHGP